MFDYSIKPARITVVDGASRTIGMAIFSRSDGASVPADMGNVDCRQFVDDWRNGAQVVDGAGAAVSYSVAAAQALGLEAGP